MGEKLVFCISDVFRDGNRIRRSIHKPVGGINLVHT